MEITYTLVGDYYLPILSQFLLRNCATLRATPTRFRTTRKWKR